MKYPQRSGHAVLFLILCLSLPSFSFGSYNIATDWVEQNIILFSTTGAFPLTGFLRAEALVDSAMFAAIVPYTPGLSLPVSGEALALRPPSERTDDNRAIALSYAAYRVLQNIYANYPNQLAVTDAFFGSLGLDRLNTTMDVSSPIGVGNRVAKRIIDARRHDRSNQYGDEPGTPVGAGPYSDFTNYVPVNSPQAQPGRTQCSELKSLNRWQPLTVLIGGFPVTQVYEGASFGLVTPFALESGMDIVPNGPPLLGTNTHDEAMRQIQQVINISGSLDDYKKASAEFWGLTHYSLFAIRLATERQLNLVETVKLVFLHGVVELDGAISAWAIKRHFDSYRPISVVQCLYNGQQFKAWAGPYQGVKTISGEDWQAYPIYDIITPLWRTPAFAEYISGHAISAGAVFEVYKRFFGSDTWGASTTVPAGFSFVEPRITAGNPGYVAGVTDVPNSGPETVGYSPAADVTLTWPTFSSAAQEAALSRMYLGIHFESGCMDALDVGRQVADRVWKKYQKLVGN